MSNKMIDKDILEARRKIKEEERQLKNRSKSSLENQDVNIKEVEIKKSKKDKTYTFDEFQKLPRKEKINKLIKAKKELKKDDYNDFDILLKTLKLLPFIVIGMGILIIGTHFFSFMIANIILFAFILSWIFLRTGNISTLIGFLGIGLILTVGWTVMKEVETQLINITTDNATTVGMSGIFLVIASVPPIIVMILGGVILFNIFRNVGLR